MALQFGVFDHIEISNPYLVFRWSGSTVSGYSRSNNWMQLAFTPITWLSTTPLLCIVWLLHRMSSWPLRPSIARVCDWLPVSTCSRCITH